MDRPKFECGDIIENAHASDRNPTRIGLLISKGYRPAGTVNSGHYVELTDGRGRTWTHNIDEKDHGLSKIGHIDILDAAAELTALRARNEAIEAALTKAKDHFVHIEEYWNGSRTDGAMFDALEEIEANATKAAAEIDAALSPEKQP